MPGTIPNIIWLYRILHIHNVDYLLRHGMYHRGHPNADPDYINIGDTDLIAKRTEWPVKIIPPGGTLGDCVPFYFGPHSPMLLNIKTGHRGITKRPQSDIVYILCDAAAVVQQCANWCFTNGHAKDALTDFYKDLANIQEVDWTIVKAKYWHNTEDDFGRMWRKQAEFLVQEHVPVTCIRHIATFNQESFTLLSQLVVELQLSIQVHIRPDLYY